MLFAFVVFIFSGRSSLLSKSCIDYMRHAHHNETRIFRRCGHRYECAVSVCVLCLMSVCVCMDDCMRNSQLIYCHLSYMLHYYTHGIIIHDPINMRTKKKKKRIFCSNVSTTQDRCINTYVLICILLNIFIIKYLINRNNRFEYHGLSHRRRIINIDVRNDR